MILMVKKLSKQHKIKIATDLLDSSYRTDINSIRINTHNTIKHEIAKLIVAYNMIKDKHSILTEAIFKNKARADILVLDTLTCIEIMESESLDSAKIKTTKYPSELNILYLTANEVINSEKL